MIPLHETPIYAELKAEREMREQLKGWRTRALLGIDQACPLDRRTLTREPLLKNGRKS